MNKSFYITTTLPYVNSDPHVGHAMEFIRADVIARYQKLQKREVFFNTGTDEHGQKVFENSKKAGKDTQEYVDEYANKFKELLVALNISKDIHFTRTTSESHKKIAQEFWKVCKKKGDIYKKEYKIKYCIGCELEKQDSDLDENGKCLVHPHLELEIREEENYFFKFSKYQKPLLELYEKNPTLVIPDFRFNEIKRFVERGLEDFSISRLKSKMPWGVPVPDDPGHVMYVWFDALVNYISCLGWGTSLNIREIEKNSSGELFQKFWSEGETVQYAGKDNLRQQAAMWQAMLMSAGIKNTDHIIINGFINSGGQKMSKSLGNVISPFDLVSEYGADALRYYCLRELSTFEDSDMTLEKFKETYNANLANGLGNLTSRIMKMAQNIKYDLRSMNYAEEVEKNIEYKNTIESFNIQKAMDFVWNEIAEVDKKIQETQPFKLVKDESTKIEGEKIITELVQELELIASLLTPFLPETSEKIKSLIKENKTPEAPLFARKD